MDVRVLPGSTSLVLALHDAAYVGQVGFAIIPRWWDSQCYAQLKVLLFARGTHCACDHPLCAGCRPKESCAGVRCAGR